MKMLFDSLWRALAYGLRPGVLLRLLVPLMGGVGLVTLLGYFFWDLAVDQMRWWLQVFPYTEGLLQWLSGSSATAQQETLAPLVLAIMATPVMVLVALLAVAQFLAPMLVRLVAGRRFAVLQLVGGRASVMTVLWSLASCLLALLALLVSAPLWVIPPLWLVVPPLILGWLTHRVLPFAALISCASREERVLICKKHQLPLFLMGVVSGYLALAPCLVWMRSGGPRFASAFILLAPLAMAIYTLLFAFSSLWFTHYCLAALRVVRNGATGHPVLKESA